MLNPVVFLALSALWFVKSTSLPKLYYKLIKLGNIDLGLLLEAEKLSFSVLVSIIPSQLEILSPILSVLINACFGLGIIPSCLKIAKIVPVFKSGDKSKVTNYRPISLLPVFSKVLEKIVYTRTNIFLIISPFLLLLNMGLVLILPSFMLC